MTRSNHRSRRKARRAPSSARSEAQRAVAKDRWLRKAYGLTLAQWLRMLELQGGVCALCGRAPKRRALNTDHDHKTGRVRGLLCWFCNRRFLGRGRENSELHAKAAVYLASTFDGRAL